MSANDDDKLLTIFQNLPFGFGNKIPNRKSMYENSYFKWVDYVYARIEHTNSTYTLRMPFHALYSHISTETNIRFGFGGFILGF